MSALTPPPQPGVRSRSDRATSRGAPRGPARRMRHRTPHRPTPGCKPHCRRPRYRACPRSPLGCVTPPATKFQVCESDETVDNSTRGDCKATTMGSLSFQSRADGVVDEGQTCQHPVTPQRHFINLERPARVAKPALAIFRRRGGGVGYAGQQPPGSGLTTVAARAAGWLSLLRSSRCCVSSRAVSTVTSGGAYRVGSFLSG